MIVDSHSCPSYEPAVVVFSVDVYFYAHVDHQDLHSFPTRRSSDLAIRGDQVVLHLSGAQGQEALGPLVASREMRSEEHTSELQSLTNLVCRLLLEKKKKV